jgi:hypothetical protein
MMRNEPVIITRSHVGQWASFGGGAALLMGVLGFIWQGGFSSFIIATLIVGVLGIGVWAFMTPQEFVGFITGRQARYGTSAVFSTLILLGIVALTFVILQRAVVTVDMTADQRFTLSAVTDSVLQRVTRDIQITGFYSAESLLLREQDDQFFRLYEVATNGRIQRRYINPDEQPAIRENFGQRFGNIADGDVFISYLTPDGEVDLATASRVPRGERQERDMTGAIARLLISGTLTVYFETSHGEINALERTQQGLSGIHAGIQESGLITAQLNLTELAAAGETIPANASTVVMARPITDLSNEEIAVIDEYLQRGGALFILADVNLNENSFLGPNSAFNQYLWDNYGIRARDAIIVDSGSSGATDIDVIGAEADTNAAMGGRLDPASAPTLFRVARALEIRQDSPTDNGWLITSSENSYGESDIQSLMTSNTYAFDVAQDITGPLNIAVWSQNQDTNARILLVGDSDFATNGYVCQACPIGNAILVTDAISWLSGLNEQLNFGFRSFITAPLIFVSGQTLDLIAFITIIIIPGVVLFTGLAIYWRRNRR